MSASKAHSFAAELKDALTHRGFVMTSSYDTDGSPLLRVGTAGAGNQTALIKIKEIAPLGTNVIGQAAVGYCPLVAQLVLETSTIANVALLVESSKLALVGELGHRGAQVELYMSANTNATGPEDIVSGNLKATFDPEPKYKTMMSQ